MKCKVLLFQKSGDFIFPYQDNVFHIALVDLHLSWCNPGEKPFSKGGGVGALYREGPCMVGPCPLPREQNIWLTERTENITFGIPLVGGKKKYNFDAMSKELKIRNRRHTWCSIHFLERSTLKPNQTWTPSSGLLNR